MATDRAMKVSVALRQAWGVTWSEERTIGTADLIDTAAGLPELEARAHEADTLDDECGRLKARVAELERERQEQINRVSIATGSLLARAQKAERERDALLDEKATGAWEKRNYEMVERHRDAALRKLETLGPILDFLGGKEPLDGAWFGEQPPGKTKYWWRENLRLARGDE